MKTDGIEGDLIKKGNILHITTTVTEVYGEWENLKFIITGVENGIAGRRIFYFKPLNKKDFPYSLSISTHSDLFKSKFTKFSLIGNLETHPEYSL